MTKFLLKVICIFIIARRTTRTHFTYLRKIGENIIFGELEKCPLREIWSDETVDFTPWLAENIEALGVAIGMELELVEREAIDSNGS